MAGYDWGRGYGSGSGYGRSRGGYGSDFGSWGDAWGGAPDSGFRGRGTGLYRQWGRPDEGRGYGGQSYDRGEYGGGYPGGEPRGMYYAGPRSYDSGLDRWIGRQWGRGGRGHDRGGGYGVGGRGNYGSGYGGGPGRGYDAGFARAPFVPEEAYRRHPEMGRRREHMRDLGPEEGHDFVTEPDLDDDEVVQAVKQNLQQDDWIHPDRIQVKASGGVVTLTGEVDDYMQARYAWDDAWETRGVHGVINNLTVRTDQPREQHGEAMPQTTAGGANAGGAKRKK